MHRITLATSLLVLLAPAAAQVGAAGETTTEMAAKATCGTTTRSDSEKSGTKFTRGIGVSASHRFCSSAKGSGSVSRYRDWRTRKDVTAARASASTSVWGGRSSSKGSADVGGSNGNGIKFTFAADKDTKGTLTVVVGGFASAKQAAAASVKFGKTTLTWKAGEKGKRHSESVTIGKAGLVFETVTSAASSLTGRGRVSASSSVSISFVADGSSGGKCTITKGVAGCGPELTGTSSSSFFGHTLTLNLTKAWPNTFGIRLWSVDGKTIAVNNCPIFSNIGLTFAFTTDKDGKASVRVPVSARRDFKWSVEFVPLRFGSKGLEFQASNTLNISCSKN